MLKITKQNLLLMGQKKWSYTDKFQFVEQNSVECWCDLGANLVQHFIGRYSRYSRYRTKSHDKSTISHVFPRYSRYPMVVLKLQEIITLLGLFRYTKSSASAELFVFYMAVQFVKNPDVLFTFHRFYGIIQLIDKLEFDEQI